MRIAIVVTSVRSIDATWTTTHLAHAALAAGHSLRIVEVHDFEITSNSRVIARAWCLDNPIERVGDVGRAISSRRLDRRYVELTACGLVLLRVNPLPWHILQLASMAVASGVPVLNSPSGISTTRGKAWLASLTDVPTPPTLVTSNRTSIEQFAEQYPGKLVIKPATGSGGRSVQLVDPTRRGSLARGFDIARAVGGPVVVQAYLPEARDGEKRLVWAGGELLGGYLRTRAPGDFRHNLKQGGRPHACEITHSDEAAARAIGPHLQQHGIGFAGLDVIGGKLVEVNTLNPGGVHWADTLGSQPRGSIARRAIQLLEATAASLQQRNDS
jgi:glutathione synthase